MQTLDGRVDLYSLGATLYSALTGHRAFPARDFRQLHTKWRVRPLPPSEIIQEIPKALDDLVMSLISYDPSARPANAAELIERLSAIAHLEIDEQLLVSQAYLTTPTLVGRMGPIKRLRKQLVRAMQGKGDTLMVYGPSGVGRSRFLDACVLEGKLAGATVLRADAEDAQSIDYGVARTLVKQLLEAFPDQKEILEQKQDVLGEAFPELFQSTSVTGQQRVVQEQKLRPRVQNEIRDWIFQIGRQRPLLMVVDDVHRIDEPSAALLAFISHKAAEHPVVIVVSAQFDTPATCEGALTLLSQRGISVNLTNLKATETTQLLGSVFGEVPNVQLVADTIHRISEGNPRDIIQLAQHLVDKKVIQYRAGAWSLPERIDAADLPINMSQALNARIDKLSADARELAEALALSPRQRFSFDDCTVLSEHRSAPRLMRSIDELVALDLLRTDGNRYRFGQPGWVAVLTNSLDADGEKKLHLRLARMFQQRGDEQYRTARHLIRAGEEQRGLDLLVAFSRQSIEITDSDPQAFNKLVQHLPSDWMETYMDAIALCKKTNRPVSELFSLQSRLYGFNAVMASSDTSCYREMISRLYSDSGLEFYHQLDDSMDPKNRLQRAIELTQKRYDQASEAERLLEPSLAIRQLSRIMINAMGMVVASCDLSFLETFPSLTPLIPLSPVLGVVENTVFGLKNRLAARYEVSRDIYYQILERIAQNDRAGLDETYRSFVRNAMIRGLGMVEASMGISSALELASSIEKEPLFELNAMQIQILYHLWQGNIEKAEQIKRNIELLRIQRNPMEVYEGSNLCRELPAYALIDDLTGVKLVMINIEKIAQKYPAWAATLHYARGEYQRIRGDYPRALGEFEQAMKATAPGRSQNWADAAGAYLRTLYELRSYNEAKKLGREYLKAAEAAGLGYMCNYLRVPLAVAEAVSGDHEAAVANCRIAIETLLELGATGINLALAYEARCRIAIHMRDSENCKKYLALYSEQIGDRANSASNAKYERLLQEAQLFNRRPYSDPPKSAVPFGRSDHYWDNLIRGAVASCRDLKQYSRLLLELLVEQSRSVAGFFYLIQKNGPMLSAQSAGYQPPTEIESKIFDYLTTEIDEAGNITVTAIETESSIANTSEWIAEDGNTYNLILLGHYITKGFVVTGIAAFLADPNRKYVTPNEIAAAISRYMLEVGVATAPVLAY